MRLKNIQSFSNNNLSIRDTDDIITDIQYICKSCSLITESLQKGFDVLQLANGDIVVTELKPVTFHYTWDGKKEKMVRQQASGKVKKVRYNKKHDINP